MAYSEIAKKATIRYIAKTYDRIEVKVKKGRRAEIAARYEISAAQVSVLLSRTRKRLRAYLKEEGLL